jgi:hypothetical protein
MLHMNPYNTTAAGVPAPYEAEPQKLVMLEKVKGNGADTVMNALIKQAHPLQDELYKSLTWDRDNEMADHPRFNRTLLMLDTQLKKLD